VLRDHRRFVRDPKLALSAEEVATLALDPVLRHVANNMLNTEGEAHRRLRGLVRKAFTSQMVQSMEPRIQAIANSLLATLRHEGCMDLVADYALPLPLTVIAELLGVPCEDRATFRAWSDTFVTPVHDANGRARFVAHLEAFTLYLRQLLARRTFGHSKGLLAALVRAEDGGNSLTDAELSSMAILLIVAGHETTANLLTNGVLALLQHPERLEEIRRTPELMEAAVEELLRYDAPLDRALTRWAAEDTVLYGKQIRRSERVVALIGAANHDYAQFARPEMLDFHRDHNPHCAFGRGPHHCLGASLARLEGRIGLATLFSTLPNLRLAVDPSALSWRDIPHMRSLVRLPVTWSSIPAGAGTSAAAPARSPA
jgi:cytochrome P450